jgi:hypothetical protein
MIEDFPVPEFPYKIHGDTGTSDKTIALTFNRTKKNKGQEAFQHIRNPTVTFFKISCRGQ